jgi:hypothetical protein
MIEYNEKVELNEIEWNSLIVMRVKLATMKFERFLTGTTSRCLYFNKLEK